MRVALVAGMLDRIRGCLLGTALGDAAGLPYEGLPPARVAHALGDASPRSRGLVPAAAIEAAIRLGGDTDTIAAIAGAITGARMPHLLDTDALDRLGRTRVWLERLAVAVADGTTPPRRHHPLVAVPANLAVGVVFVGYALRLLVGSASRSH